MIDHHRDVGGETLKFHDLVPFRYHFHAAGDVARTETCGVPYSEGPSHALFSKSAPSHGGEATGPDNAHVCHFVALGVKVEISLRVICASALEHPPLPCASMPRYGYLYL